MQHPPAFYHAVVVVDVARFTDPSRTTLHQLAVHEGLYEVLQRAFDEAGIGWQSCQVEDRGDGALILVHPNVSKGLLVDQLPSRLLAGLRRYNRVYSAEAAIQLRLAMHAGEVHRDEHGVVSQAVNLAFRILDAQAAKVALAQSNGSLAVIASDSFYREVVLPDPAANPDAFRQIPVSIKQTDTVAWLLLPDSGGGSDTTGVRGRGQTGTSGGLFDLVDALLEVPCVRDDADRRLLLDLLSPRIANTVSYNPRARWHVLSLVRVCLNYDGGLAELVDAVRKMDGDSLAVRRLEAVVREWSIHPPD